jgi:hypothetical protein
MLIGFPFLLIRNSQKGVERLAISSGNSFFSIFVAETPKRE